MPYDRTSQTDYTKFLNDWFTKNPNYNMGMTGDYANQLKNKYSQLQSNPQSFGAPAAPMYDTTSLYDKYWKNYQSGYDPTGGAVNPDPKPYDANPGSTNPPPNYWQGQGAAVNTYSLPPATNPTPPTPVTPPFDWPKALAGLYPQNNVQTPSQATALGGSPNQTVNPYQPTSGSPNTFGAQPSLNQTSGNTPQEMLPIDPNKPPDPTNPAWVDPSINPFNGKQWAYASVAPMKDFFPWLQNKLKTQFGMDDNTAYKTAATWMANNGADRTFTDQYVQQYMAATGNSGAGYMGAYDPIMNPNWKYTDITKQQVADYAKSIGNTIDWNNPSQVDAYAQAVRAKAGGTSENQYPQATLAKYANMNQNDLLGLWRKGTSQPGSVSPTDMATIKYLLENQGFSNLNAQGAYQAVGPQMGFQRQIEEWLSRLASGNYDPGQFYGFMGNADLMQNLMNQFNTTSQSTNPFGQNYQAQFTDPTGYYKNAADLLKQGYDPALINKYYDTTAGNASSQMETAASRAANMAAGAGGGMLNPAAYATSAYSQALAPLGQALGQNEAARAKSLVTGNQDLYSALAGNQADLFSKLFGRDQAGVAQTQNQQQLQQALSNQLFGQGTTLTGMGQLYSTDKGSFMDWLKNGGLAALAGILKQGAAIATGGMG